MNNYTIILKKFLKKECITNIELTNIINDLNIYQCSVLSYLIYWTANNISLDSIVKIIFNKFPDIRKYIYCLFETGYSEQIMDGNLSFILKSIYQHKTVGKKYFDYFITKLVKEQIEPPYPAIFLINIYINGLTDEDIYSLTISMRDSGNIYDYRRIIKDKIVVRRYPTGALSEKIALLLPSMLLSISTDVPLISTFLVAKSLSFTGGTWDKLSVIDNFHFPDPGVEAIQVLQQCNIAMTVAKADLCPADTILYKIRSITGTVDSIPLAVASIASKQLASPADVLLLDIRYGDGAFFDKKEATILMEKIGWILVSENFRIINRMTFASQPNGSCIGNYLEVFEAISIMKKNTSNFNEFGIKEQVNILIDFFSELMHECFPEKTKNYWAGIGNDILNSGALLKSFEKLLITHNVKKETVNALLSDPLLYFNMHRVGYIHANKAGTITYINQKKLGNIVNFGFDSEKELPCPNIQLHKRLGDAVTENDSICSLYYQSKKIVITDKVCCELRSCFNIE